MKGSRTRARGRRLSTMMLAGTLAGLLLSGFSAGAADLPFVKARKAAEPLDPPAVEGWNAKVEGYGGSIANRSVAGAQGSITAPLPGPFGIQIDGGGGSFGGNSFNHIGGHLFWRNPSRALLGIYASNTFVNQFGGVSVNHVGAEGEYYWGRFTLQGVASVEFGNSASSGTTTTTIVPPAGGVGVAPGVATTSTFIQGFDVKTTFFDVVNLKYYFTDDASAYVGHRFLGDRNALALGTEVGLPLSRGIMGTAFIEGRVGEGAFHGIWGGLRFYFGDGDKPLIARHRTQDPSNWMSDTLFGVANSSTSSGSSSSTTFCTPPLFIQNGVCGGL
jgi:hypothetical protein